MTGRALLRRLLRNTRLLDRWRDSVIVPLGARPVLDAVAEMVASAGDEGEYRLDPEIEGHRSLAGWVAWRMDVSGAEAEIGSHLRRLERAGLIATTAEGGLRLPLPEKPAPRRWTEEELAELTPRRRSAILNGQKGGRPRKQVEGQRELGVLAVVGGNEAPRTPRAETHGETQAAGLGFAENPRPGEAGFLGSASLAAADLYQNVESHSLEEEQQPSIQEPSGAREKPTVGFRENPPLETQGRKTHGKEPATPGVAGIVEAQTLALALAGAIGLTQEKGTGSTRLVTEWLSYPGMDGGRIREIVLSRKRRHDALMARDASREPIGSFDYFDDAIRGAAGLPPKGRPPARPDDADTGLVTLDGFSFPAHVDLKALKAVEPAALPYLAGAVGFAQKGQDGSLDGSLKRLQSHPKALALLRELVPDLAERVARAAGPRRAAG